MPCTSWPSVRVKAAPEVSTEGTSQGRCDGIWPMAPGLHKALCIKRVGGQVDVSTLATHQGARKQPHRKDGLGAGQVVQWSARRRRMASSCRIKGRWRVGSRTAVWPAMARTHNPRVGECLISKRALLCTKSATAASASAVTDRPRIRCVRLAMLSSRTKPSTVAGVLGSCLVTKVRYLLTRVMISAGSPETSGHCARAAEGRPSISLTVMSNEGLVRVIAAPVRGLHLLQGPQTLAQGPTRRQHGRLRGEGGASIRLLGRRRQVLGTDPGVARQPPGGPRVPRQLRHVRATGTARAPQSRMRWRP